MKAIDWKLPRILSGPGKYLKKADAIAEILAHWSGSRRLAIQAGAHIGIWPARLSDEFERVVCFEPEPENARCARHNLSALPNVTFYEAVIGERHGHAHLMVHGKSTAVHHVADRGLRVPSYRIDGFELDDVDALFLDIEGAEIQALKGAMRTIARCKPLIVAEECRYVSRFGHARGDIARLLDPLGYRQVGRVGEDLVLVP